MCQSVDIWFCYSHPTLLAGVILQDTSTKSKNLWIIYCPHKKMFWYILVFSFQKYCDLLTIMQYGSSTCLSHQTILMLLSIEGSECIYVLEYVKPLKYEPAKSEGWICVVVCAWCWAFCSDLSCTSQRTYQYFVTMPISFETQLFLLSQHLYDREHNNGNHG